MYLTNESLPINGKTIAKDYKELRNILISFTEALYLRAFEKKRGKQIE